MITSQHIRQQCLQKRRQLSPEKIVTHSKKISQQLWQLKVVQQAKQIAVYHAMNDEVNLLEFMLQAWQKNKSLYLPCINPIKKNLAFKPYKKNSVLIKNCFNILEPQSTHVIPQQNLDIVLVPLVAFDQHLNRLGMGGGFYDRTFKLHKNRQQNASPLLIGVAFELQKLTYSLPTATWDIPMNYIITETTLYT